MIVDLPTFTWIHTAISLVALAAGIVVVCGLATGRRLVAAGWQRTCMSERGATGQRRLSLQSLLLLARAGGFRD
jgi:hypothetical protein